MEKDRRRYPRIPCDGIAAVDLGDPMPCPARILDLSAEGCLIQLEKPRRIHRGAEMMVSFEVAIMPFGIRAHAKSIRSETTIGFYFPDLTKNGRTDLEDLIAMMTTLTQRPAMYVSPGIV